jgi:hypothetical protein
VRPDGDFRLIAFDFESDCAVLIYTQDRFSNRVSLRDSGKDVGERRFSSMSSNACTNK